MSYDLKTCPFCGSSSVEFVAVGAKVNVWCPKCGCFGPTKSDYPKAANAWNRRAERTCRMAPNKAASDAMFGHAVSCDACGSAYPAAIQMSFCPSCGARVVDGE